MNVKAYLEITMKIDEANRPAAAKVYTDYRGPFLAEIKGALTKDLLIRDEDVYVQKRCIHRLAAPLECCS